ncbi:MAG: DUF1724 domain-containing protein [Candidatus Bathyarchaeota archaeon]|nr:DUF1724 domain-containing protein [Candidatus Bathyarchaeota archaeon]MDH5732213.1 DUF1724 domain-containing protein [Candidatus Bathyarchaeota archaeon]
MLFELSNEDRLRILYQLDKKAMNVTRLSKALDLTTQETSRHVSRLSDVGLTQKDVEGLHHVTFYGEVVLKQLGGLRFISQHNDYFTSHTLAHVPSQFLCRIGELADAHRTDNIMVAFYDIEKMMREAEEYIWTIADQYLVNTIPLFREAVERKVSVRNIEPIDYYRYHYLPDDREAFDRARIADFLEERILERLDVFLSMSEREVAGVAFPLPDEKFDYLGFTATDERAHTWCEDLFQYYWERAPTRASKVEELYKWIKGRPKAIDALKGIAMGQARKYTNEKELIPKFERMGLTKQGKLTLLGDLVSERFQ